MVKKIEVLFSSKIWNNTVNILFPVILLLFSFMHIGKGITITDTGYNYGNFLFFDKLDDMWKFSTYLANVVGVFFTKLPLGKTMIGLNFYTCLFKVLSALGAYYFCINICKMRKEAVFVGELIALGFCWCPTALIYNYLTYFLFHIAAMLLYIAIVKERKGLFVIAGFVLGVNLFVRLPNLAECALIVVVWLAGIIRKSKFKKVLMDTFSCIIGYLAAIIGIFGYIAFKYGVNTYLDGIKELFSMTESATSYSPIAMIIGNITVYFDYFGWFVFGIILIIAGMIAFKIFGNKLMIFKQIMFCIVMVVYVLFLYKRGNFTINYRDYSSMFFWGVMFLIFILGFSLFEMFNSKQRFELRILALINIVMVLITPIGSNNNLYSPINNLFLGAPVILNLVVEIILYAKNISLKKVEVNIFPFKMFCITIMGCVLLQSFLFGINFVFRDGNDGAQRNSRIANNSVLKGMHTNEKNAEELQGLNDYLVDNELTGTEVILFGEIPAAAFYFSLEPAISSTWPDLPSFKAEKFCEEIDKVESEDRKPIVIVSSLNAMNIAAYADVDEVGTEWETKIKKLQVFLYNNNYEQRYINDGYVVYEKVN